MDIILVFIVAFIAGIDQFSLLESLYQPIVTGPIIGAILGQPSVGLTVGATFQLMTIGNMPVGGAQPPNAVIGGIMAVVFAVKSGMDAQAAVAAAYPFALLGQYAVTLTFTVTSPIMAKADKMAEEADTKGINRLNMMTMALIGALFGVVVCIGLIAGDGIGKAITKVADSETWGWIMPALSAAGGMMRYVGFATLLKVMVSSETWGFYFMGFAMANILAGAGLSGQALLLLAFIGVGIALWDYQIQVKVKNTAGSANGGDEDGI